MDMKNLMDMIGQVRTQLADTQANAAEQRFTGEAGGGMVRVVINGRHETLEVKIDPAAVDPNDVSLLEDLVRAAVNAATTQLTAQMQDRIGDMAAGFGIDPSMLGGEPPK